MKNDPYTQREAVLYLPPTDETQTIDPYCYDLLGLTPIERNLRAFEKNGIKHVTFFLEKATDKLKAVLEKGQPWQMGFSFVEKEQQADTIKSYQLFPPTGGLLICKEPVVVAPQLIGELYEKAQQHPNKPCATHHQLLVWVPPALLKEHPQLVFGENTLPHLYTLRNTRPSLFCCPVRTEQEAAAVKRLLVRHLTKPNDGWVSRHLNRPISTFFSRWLAPTKVTPNQVTLALVLPSLFTGWVLAQGGYWGFLLGGALFHLTSILDGVDGELARLKFKSSLFGKWLDFMCDNLAYLAALIGYLFGLFRDGISPFEKTASITALLLTLAMMTSIILYYKRFNKDGKLLTVDYGFRHGRRLTDRLMQWGELLGKREWFALIFFFLAIIGKMEWALVYICLIAGGVLLFSFGAHSRARRLGY